MSALRGFEAVPIDQVHPAPGNPRRELRDIQQLAISIQQSTMLQPIVVQRVPGQPGYRVIAGHRRLAAAKHLGWAQVPVIIRRDMLPDEELVAMLSENGQRSDLDPIEEARAYKRLVDGGMAMRDVGVKCGRSIAHVSNRLALLTLPESELEELRAGNTTVSAVNEQLRTRRRAARKTEGKSPMERGWHFGSQHPLASRARDACQQLGHLAGRKLTGSVACGECWEAVIRADERTNARKDHP